MNYYTCSNMNPNLDGTIAGSDFPIIEIASIILHIYIQVRISLFRRKKKRKDDLKPKIWMITKSLTLKQIEFQSISDFTSNVVVLAICCSYSIFAKKMKYLTLIELNMSPNNILMNIFQLVCPCFITCIISVVYYSRQPLLRRTMLRELKNCFTYV